MAYNPNFHHRRSIRLKGYDYSQAGLFFITICCKDRTCLYGEVIDGTMKLNKFGEIALSEWNNTEKIRTNCRIYESIIMPNHMHGIIEITQKIGEEKEIGKFESPSHSIGSIIRGYKIATIKKIKEIIQESSTGELQFAPTAPTQFAPTQFAPTAPTAPTQFAPTPTPTAPTEFAQIIISLDYKIWQRNYWEHIIRDEIAYNRIAEYIINNPSKWDNDTLKT